MLQEHLDRRFLSSSPLASLGSFLMKFSEQSRFPVSIRSLGDNNSVYKMKIVMHNKACSILRGFKDGSMVGLTAPQILDTLSISANQKKTELDTIEDNDQKAIKNNQQNTHNQVTLDKKGLIRIFQRVVTPLTGYDGKVIALSTIAIEVTQYTKLLFLLELYKKFYSNAEHTTSSVASKLSEYLELDAFFVKQLTMSEMTTLLAMTTDSRHKQVAALIKRFYQKDCSPKTVANYIATTKNKLKSGIEIHQVLYHLRDSYQRQSLLFD